MRIKALYLKNFRNIEEVWIEFSGGVNWFSGPNATGKTNLLEALFYFVRASSFRTRHLNELILENKECASLEIFFTKYGIEQTLKLVINHEEKTFSHNQTSYKTALELLGILQGVLIKIDDINLISGAPQLRRSFIDLQLVQASPLYVHHLLRFQRALKHRNFCLKIKKVEPLESFESEMVRSSKFLWEARGALMERLKPLVQENYARLSGEELFEIRYDSYEGDYQELLTKNRSHEIRLGYTKEGPHRDELFFFIQGKPAKSFASEGQKRTAMMALKLAEWQNLYKMVGEKPLCAIDEWHSNLDKAHKKSLWKALEDLGQVFITTHEVELNQLRYQIQGELAISLDPKWHQNKESL